MLLRNICQRVPPGHFATGLTLEDEKRALQNRILPEILQLLNSCNSFFKQLSSPGAGSK